MGIDIGIVCCNFELIGDICCFGKFDVLWYCCIGIGCNFDGIVDCLVCNLKLFLENVESVEVEGKLIIYEIGMDVDFFVVGFIGFVE